MNLSPRVVLGGRCHSSGAVNKDAGSMNTERGRKTIYVHSAWE